MKNLAQDTRRALRLGTALATGIIGIIQGPAAFAQNIPDNTMPTITNANATASGAVITTVGTLGTVDLTNGGTTVSRNLIWSDFSIGANNTVSFVATGDALTSLTALNNVTNGAPISVIEGQITSQSNVAVWLINPQGMLFSSGSSFSGGHLILSTLPAVNAGDTTNILDQTGAIDLGQTGGSASAFPGAITIAAGASIDASLGTGANVSLISQRIDVSGSITAPGDVGLVLGHAVTLPSSLGSPLGYTITAGTRLATAKLLATGTINGANVSLAAIAEDAVTGALLQVDSSATLTATADGGSVILSATRTNPGSASLVSDGTLQATNTNGSVSITADGTASVTGTVTTAGTGTYSVTANTVTLGGTAARTQFGANGVIITATGGNVTATNALTLSSNANIGITSNTNNAFVHSAVSAGGTYSVTGDNVTLGDGTAVLQQAAGAVIITARTGDLTTGTGLSLVSTGSTATLDGSSGNVQIGGKVVANGTIAVTAQDDVRIASYNAAGDTGYLRSDAGNVTVDAGGSVYGIGTPAAAATILASQSGIDSYAATGSLTVNATGDVYAGTLSAGTDLILNVTGALLGSAGPTGTNVPGGAIFANGAGGTVSVTATGGGGSVALNRVEAASNVTIWGDQIAIGTLKHGGTLDLSDAGGGALAATDSYIGLLGVTGNLILNLTDAAVVTNVVATENIGAGPVYLTERFSNAFGNANLNATTGNITGAVGAGAQLGTVTAGGYIDVDAGGIVANSVTSGTYVDLIATAGTLSLLTVNAGTTLTLAKQAGLLATPGDDLRVVTGTAGGTITATSSTSARIGLLSAIFGNISVTATLGDISGLRTGTAAALGTVTTTNLLSTAYGSADFTANTGSVTLNAANGGIQAGDINLLGGAGDITATAQALTLDLAVAQRDLNLTATLGTLYLGTGSIGRTALVTKSGGSIATVGDELRIGVLVGGTTTAPGGTTVASSTHVRANTIDDRQSSVSITATAGDVVIGNRVLGTTNVGITAGRDVQIANYVAPLASGYVRSLSGSVTIDAGGSVYGIGGSATDLPTTARGTDGYAATGNLTVNATGDAYVGTLIAGGNILLNIAGGLFGSNGTPGTNIPGGAVFANGAGGTVTVNANGVGGVNVLNRVEAAGNITLKGAEIAVGTPLAGGTLFLLDLTNNPLAATNYYIGVTTVAGDFILNLADPTTITNMIALEDTSGGLGTYAPEFFDNTVGKTDLDAGGRISGTVGNGAQLGTVAAGGFIDLTTGAVVADSVTSGGSINIIANTGTLSLLGVAASGGLTLTKNAGSIATAGDDLRVVIGTATGGTTLVSNTSIRVGDLTDATGNIALTASNGDISGLLLGGHNALPTTTAVTALSTDWDKANLTATLGSVTVTAANGAAQLGTLTAGTGVVADAKALTAASAAAGGLIDLAVTSGTLYLGTGTAGGAIVLDKAGVDGNLRFVTLSAGGPATTILTSDTDIVGTTVSTTSGDISIGADNDIQITTIGSGAAVSAVAQRDASFGTVTGVTNVFVGGVRDLVAANVISTTGDARARAGRNVTVTGQVNGATIGEAFAGILDATGALTAGNIVAGTTAIARAGANGQVTSMTAGTNVQVVVGGNFQSGAILAGTDASITVTGEASLAGVDTGTGAVISAASIRADHVTATTGNISLTATTGDISGLLTGAAGALPTTTSGTLLSTQYDKLDATATAGSITVTAASGGAQLGTLVSGTDIVADALALTADSATAGGLIDLAVTSGTLYLGSGSAGLTATLDKTGSDDELRFGTLVTGNTPGGLIADATVRSSTNIRGTSITARSGAILVEALNGQATGLAGGRLALSALGDLDGTPLSDLSITVNTGGLARLGNLQAGTDILITAQNFLTPPTFGSIDILNATSARGDVRLRADNAAPSGTIISFVDISAGNFARVDASGGVGGNIVGNNITGTNGAVAVANNGSVTLNNVLAINGLAGVGAFGGNATLNSLIALNGNVLSIVSNDFSATTLQSSTDVTINAGRDIDATNIDAATFIQLDATRDIAVGTADAGTTAVFNAGNDIGVTSLTSGGNADLTAGRDIISGTTSSGGYAHFGATRDIEANQLTAATDVQLTAGANIRAGQLTSSTSSVTLAANGGNITGLGGFTATAANRPDILAAGAILITSTGSTQLDTAQAGTSLTVTAGTATSDGEIDINTASALGAILLDAFATSPAADANHDGGVRVGTANAGTTLTLTNVARGTGIGDITIGTSATSGSDAFIDAADNARIAQATAAGTLAIRAGDEISGLTAGSAANLSAGEDLALKSGAAVNLANATAGDDLIIESATTITAGALTVSGSGPDLRSVSFASPTAIAIVASEPNPGASIVLRSSGGSVDSTGLLSATGSVTIEAADGASVTGGVDAGGNYSVTAVNAILLGGAGATTQSANGAVTITSTTGQVTQGSGALTLTANSDAVGTEALTITAPGGITLGNATLSGASIALVSSGGSVTAGGAMTSNGNIAVNAGNLASVTGGVNAGGNYSVTAVNAILLGGAGATTQSANGAVTITSTTGQVTQGSGALTLTANSDAVGTEALTITAPGGITLGNAALSGAGIGLVSSGGSVTAGGAVTATGDIVVNAGDQANVTGGVAAGGNYSVTAANTILLGGASDTVQSAMGAVTITSTTGQVTQGGGVLTLTANSDGVGTEALTITAPGGIALGNSSLSGGDAGHQSAITLAASGGQITIGTVSGARLGVTAQSGFTANGAITAGNGTLGADLAAGPATVDIVVSAGGIATQAITATGADHDIRLAASGAIATGALIAARSVTVGGATSGSSATSFTAPTITATSGAIGVKAGTIAVAGAQSAGTTINLDATNGTLQIGAIAAPGGDVTLAATGKATLNGVVNAVGRNVSVTASDADFAATVTAARITLVNRAGTANVMRIGTNPGGTGGFVLDQAEFDRLSAPALVLDSGTGAGLTRQDIAIGGLLISNPVVKTIDFYGLQRIDLTGNLATASGSTLTGLRLGGTATAADLASVLRVAATADGLGGRIDIGTGALDLRAAIIGVGQDTGFLNTLGVTPGSSGGVDPRLMVNNILPGLYNSAQGGGLPYLPAGQQLIRASSMSVSYSNFALFQNTALPGDNSGAVLGSLAMPSVPAMSLVGLGAPQAGAFAIFGQINGIGGVAAALLGNSVVNVTSIDRTVARINGCLIGSGAGCLSSVVLTPTLGNFDPVRGDIFYARTDFELPFDPLVGTNNDSLFGDVGTFGLSDVPLEPIDCDPKIDASCPVQDKDAK